MRNPPLADAAAHRERRAALERQLAELEEAAEREAQDRAHLREREVLRRKIEEEARQETEALNRHDTERQEMLAAAYGAVVSRVLGRLKDIDDDMEALAVFAAGHAELSQALQARGGRARPLNPPPVVLGHTSARGVESLRVMAQRHGVFGGAGGLWVRSA